MRSLRSHLCFNSDIGSLKPENIIHTEVKCPFCDRSKLEGILERRDDILWIKNKYPVLQDAYQTVIIETKDCYSELSQYSKEHLHTVIRFGMEKWLEMKQNKEYASVIFFKNHGPFSGGTIRHPHMQIVGLKYIDCQKRVSEESFQGLVVDRRSGVELNLTTKPKVGFTEFNVILDDLTHIDQMADYIQIIAHYLLNHFHKKCNSYNIFFYEVKEHIIAKIMPRFVTSPLFIGYSIPHVSNQLEKNVKQVQEIYFNR